MDDDPQDIYEAPSLGQEHVTTNFKQLLTAFQGKQNGLIQMAKDGRYQADKNKAPKPKPAVKPKPINPFGAGNAPMLPVKKSKQLQQPRQEPTPQLPPKVTASPKHVEKTSRVSMFPPDEQNGNDDKKKQNPINGLQKVLTSKQVRFSGGSSYPEHPSPGTSTEYSKRVLPPEPEETPPPTKPEPLADVSLDEFTNDMSPNRQDEDWDDSEEIYDDIAPPPDYDMDEPSLPPRQTGGRPISLIPEMTEEDELQEGAKRRNLAMAVCKEDNDDDAQEVYDDVEGRPDDDDIQEEIYEAVE